MIYLDHNATAPLRPAARAALTRALDLSLGNPSSGHSAGRAAKAALEQARAQVAALCGCAPAQVVFTSGGTEANNLAVTDLIRRALRQGRRHVLALPLEHPSVRAPLAQLEALGAITLEWLPVGAQGRLDVEEAARRVRPGQTGLVCCMAAHNSLGTVYPVEALAQAAHCAGALLHCDATQAAGKLPMRPFFAADTLTLSAHKLGGPAGVGALICRAPVATPLLLGGGQEGGARSGTENLLGAVAFGAAAQDAAQDLEAFMARARGLTERLWAGVLAAWPRAQRNSPAGDGATAAATAARLPNTLHVSFLGVDGLLLTRHLDRLGVAVSAGSACQGGGRDWGLQAAGLSAEAVAGAVRFSLGPDTTGAQVVEAVAALGEALPLAVEVDEDGAGGAHGTT